MARIRRVLFFVVLFLMLTPYCYGQKYIVIGVPTSLKLINGYEGEKAARLAVEEINGKGGVKVGGKPMLMKIEALDIRDGEPGVPVSEALLGIEKLILDKKIYAAVVGNFRSEALLAAMDIYSKYKTINLTSIAMSPKFQEKVLSDKQKYKYSFRTGMDSRYAADCLQGMMKLINKELGYNKVFIMTGRAMGHDNRVTYGKMVQGEWMERPGIREVPHRGNRFFVRPFEGKGNKRPGHHAHLRYADLWYPGEAAQKHEDSRYRLRPDSACCGNKGLDYLRT